MHKRSVFDNMAEAAVGFNIEQVKRDLEEHGVAVVPGVISEDECDDHVTEFHQWLARFGVGFPDNVGSIIHKYKVAHMHSTWTIRLKAKPVFEQLWNTKKLLSSYDGIAIAAPPELNGDTAKCVEPDLKDHNALTRYGLHHDQGNTKIGLHAYQGAVYLEETEETDWAFVVLEDSHHHHQTFFEQFVGDKKQRSEFRRLKQKELDWFLKRNCRVKRVACPKGGIILWDSRTVHAGAPPVQNRPNQRWRYVSFVCMAPAIWAREEDIKTKVTGYNTLSCSRHWPCNGASNFKDSNRYDAMNAVDALPAVAETKQVKQLIGREPYDFNDGQSNGPEWTPRYREPTAEG